MYAKEYADRVAGGVFLIGLAVLFTPLASIVGGWWPGILFVLGASAIARGVAEGQSWYSVSGGIWLIGLGIVFLVGFSLPLLLILLGVTMITGYSLRPGGWTGRKVKIGDDGELVDDDEKRKNDDSLV